MCGRFYIDDFVYREIERFRPDFRQIGKRILDPREYSDPPRPRDVYPTNIVPVIVGGGSTLDASYQQWGFPNFARKGVIINARAETVKEKKTFRDSIIRRRCIILAPWFYEWNQAKEKITFYREDDNMLFLAGLYKQIDGLDRFVLLTTDANESMKETHNRMPLIIERSKMESWILDDAKTEDFLKQENVQLQKRADYEQQVLQFE